MKQKEIQITSEYEKVADVCEAFRNFCAANNISESHYIKIEICLTEALNNVIKHSYNGKSGNIIKLNLTFVDSRLELAVSDEGKTRENFEKPKLDFDPTDIDNLPEGGMGLFIIEEIMDETKYHSDGKTNTFTMVKAIN